MKVCNVCGVENPKSAFSPNRGTLRTDCKVCHAKKSKLAKLRRKLETVAEVAPLSAYDVDELSTKYSKDKLWVARGLKACRLTNIPESYFVSRYLDKNTSEAKLEKVEKIIRELSEP